jgi:general L-amino acid transport system ATP-binding protein
MTLPSENSAKKTVTNTAIKIENLNKWYGDHHVLKEVSLDIFEGEIMVICGPSGSGKSHFKPS